MLASARRLRSSLAMLAFAEQVRADASITDVVNIGIGGSDLGPQMAVVALDDDKAGVSHGPRIALALDGVALDVTVRLPARGKDWNDVLCTEAT